ncbi:hypothetical protein BKA64DRAFT_722635 [Cadophora sp. MPI-SDFR-AT-0126]|nr:hypothetical protein BKA64DRAFT_722635 [Leotiomycetes sp. MPI-SDFR-AT-0126]
MVISRKPVGVQPGNISVPSQPRTDEISDDGVSAMSRFSSKISRSPDGVSDSLPRAETTYGHSMNDIDIGQQGIPLVDFNAAKTAPTQNGQYSRLSGNMSDLREGASDDEPGMKNTMNSSVQENTPCLWLPKALRWPFMAVLAVVTLGLGLLVLGLTIQSERNYGLGTDRDSSIFLFGWRFTPTLFAVIYTLLLMAMFNDVRRTEVFARLSTPSSSTAAESLFYKPGMFWLDPINAMRKEKSAGVRNRALFWASMVYILGLLIISPFSAAFLSPAEVSIPRDASFSRLSTSSTNPMKLTSDDEIYFRTISSVLLNTTTSAWLSNNYTIIPFWPSTMKRAPLGASLSSSEQRWIASTTVYRTELDCKVMELKHFTNTTLNQTIYRSNGTIGYTGRNMTSFILTSDDGCSLGYSGHPTGQSVDSMFDTGGGWWSGFSNFSYPLLGQAGNGTAEGVNSSNPIMLNTSSECGNRRMFFLSTPDDDQGFQAKGYICGTIYFSAEIPVTISSTGSFSQATFDVELFNRTKAPISANVLDISQFENAFLSQNWTSKFQAPNSAGIPTQALRPQIGGPLILVGAQNNFDLRAMIGNSNLPDQARQVQQRFLGESMQSLFRNSGTEKSDNIPGQIVHAERRIIASLTVGVLLTTMLLLSSLMIAMVTYHTRFDRRPLNLYQDPASTLAVASLIRSESSTRALFDGLDRSSESSMLKQLDGYSFSLRSGVLYAFDMKDAYEQSAGNTPVDRRSGLKPAQDWRPKLLRGWLLGPLLLFLAALVIVISVLFAKYRRSGIYQSFLVSSVNIKVDNRSREALAPYSIIPTLIAVGVKLWWGSIDEIFRRLQPYVSMAVEPTKGRSGTALSYISSPLVWAIGKAARYRHWLLAVVATGAFLTEIFTVGMSALWDRNPGVRSRNINMARSFEFRSVPAVFEVLPPSVHGYTESTITQAAKASLSNIFGDLLTGWMYSSINEGTYNSTLAAWTSDDWAFLPVDLDTVPVSSSIIKPPSITGQVGALSAVNATLGTPAIRGRLECTPFDMTKNISAWLNTLDFTNKTAWNDSHIPPDLRTGYELKTGFALNRSSTGGQYRYWDGTYPYFSFFSTNFRLTCCANETDDAVNEASIGYWSSAADYPSTSVVVKWIKGFPYSRQFNSSTSSRQRVGDGSASGSHWTWKDIPEVTALNCTPIFETANATVTVDTTTQVVQNYTILDKPQVDSNAFAYNYVQLNVSKGVNYSSQYMGGGGYQVKPGVYLNNMTVSYGYLFLSSLLGASNSALTGYDPMTSSIRQENLDDRTYNFRLPGLNVDFMSYVSLSLAQNNPSLLLDPMKLGNISSTVFSMFFKHFVHSDVRSNGGMYMNGTWVLQPRGAVPPSDLGPTRDSMSKVYLQDTLLPSGLEPITNAIVTTRIEQLDLSPAAVILCLSILCFLLLTTVVVLGWHRQYLRLLPRDVDTLGSVLGFVYASDRLLKSSGHSAKRAQRGEMVSMGWFESGGKRRWGVEIIDQTDDPRSRDESSSTNKRSGYTQCTAVN